ncbi:MAG: hypothetical protein KY475_26395 [Planctomycetes bacterium]|nr:hypothetical protein [Planctomycetota bacterium]
MNQPDKDDGMDIKMAVGAVRWGAWLARKVRWNRMVWRVRDRALLNIVRQAHCQTVHPMRQLAMAMRVDDPFLASILAVQVCNGCHNAMANFLEIPESSLHCCLKLVRRQGDADEIGTVGRSEPFDGRPIKPPEEDAHPIQSNSVWSSLYGVDDGKSRWRQFRCFACNNLPSHDDFRCSREGWKMYYRSALVYPLRCPADVQGNDMLIMGFLAFDSPDTNAFRGLPDIFNYRDAPHEYHHLLEDSTAFHLGAIFADVLGTFLGAVYKDWSNPDGLERFHAIEPAPAAQLPAPGTASDPTSTEGPETHLSGDT